MTILLLGKNGQVGRQLQRSLAPVGDLRAVDRATLDLAHPECIRPFLDALQPRIIVNAAAYTAVDQAEQNSDLVNLINCEAVDILARGAKDLDALFVHYSTDYVFDGELDRPYREDDATGPLNVYGQSKLAAERRVAESCADALIFRASWIYGDQGKNFPTTILQQAQSGRSLRVVADSIGAPTDAALIADVTAASIVKYIKGGMAPGLSIYHLAAAGETSWFDYARFIIGCAQKQGLTLTLDQDDVLPILQKDFNNPAQRPKNSRLDTTKLRTELGIDLPDWTVGVDQFVKRHGQGEQREV